MEITVSIICDAYNHEKFIAECLDGFVLQKTNFNFEVLVHDDASTDNTANIIREYEAKYPEFIKPIYQSENQYSKHRPGYIWRNFQFPRAKGKYVAFCEGDDYWTDPYKLQKQVDFLEGNPDYTMCFHNAKALNKDGIITSFDSGVVESRDYSGEEFLRKWFVPTASVVVRRNVLNFKYKDPSRILYGDVVLFLTASELGRVRGLQDSMSVYRIIGSSTIHSSNGDKRFREGALAHYQFILDNFKELDAKAIRRKVGWAHLRHMTTLKPFSISWFKDLFYGLWLNPKLILEKILGRNI